MTYTYMRRALLPAGFILLHLLSPAAHAQPQFRLTGYVIRDDNAFRSSAQTNDWINIFAFQAAQTRGARAWAFRVSYDGDYSRFAEYTDRQNTGHRFSLGYTAALGTSVTGSVGFSTRLRFNTNQYELYDSQQYRFFGTVRWPITPTRILTIGMNSARTQYSTFAEVNNDVLEAFSRVQIFLPSRTSLAVETHVGRKVYTEQTRQSAVFTEAGGFLQSAARLPPPKPTSA